MIKCVGIQFKKGSFTDQVSGKDIAFDNVIFHLETRLAPDPTVFGVQVDQVKIKRSSLEYILGGAFDPQAFLDHELILEYTPVNGKPVLTNIQALD